MGEVREILTSYLVPVLTGAIIGAVAVGLGAFLAQPFSGRRRPFLVESFGLGTLAISLTTLLWGSLSWMGISARWSLGFLLLMLSVIGWIRHTPTTPLKIRSFGNRTILALGLLLLIGVIMRIILAPLYPPFAWDECASYLPAAQRIVDTGTITFNPDIRFDNFPQNTEMLYAWATAHSPMSSAHYVNFLAFLFSLLALVRLGRLVFSVKVGWLAALIMGCLWTVQFHSVHCYVDIWVLFYFLASVLMACEALKYGSSRKVLLAGIFLGAAMGVKYTAIFGAITMYASLIAMGGSKSPDIKAVPRWSINTAAILALLVASPWYIRNIIWFQNPVFPFFGDIFRAGGGTFGMFSAELAARQGTMLNAYASGVMPSGGPPWVDFARQWFMWIGVPAGFWIWFRSPFARVAVTWTILTWILRMLGTEGNVFHAYYFYLIPVNILLIANLAAHLYTLPPGNRLGRFVRIVVWLLLIVWIGAFGAVGEVPVPQLASWQQERILSERNGSYNLITEANIRIASDRTAIGILCEDGRLYANFRLIGGSDTGYANHRVIARSCGSPQDLARLIRVQYGADYLIVHRERLEKPESAALGPFLQLMSDPGFAELFQLEGRIGSGEIYFLRGTSPAQPVPVSDPE